MNPADLLSSANLIRRLITGKGSGSSQPASDAQAFAQALEKAREKDAPSREVTIGSGVHAELSSNQKAALAKAADQAESQGLHTALVLLDGQAFTVDVATREITGVTALKPGAMLPNIDGVIMATSVVAEGKPTGPTGLLNESLRRVIGGDSAGANVSSAVA